jgi:hypothetical protein
VAVVETDTATRIAAAESRLRDIEDTVHVYETRLYNLVEERRDLEMLLRELRCRQS